MPTREDIVVAVLAARPITPALLYWLTTFPAENVHPSRQWGNSGGTEMLAVWRNQIVADFLEHTDLPYLMMVDADAWPVPRSDGIIYAEGDVCGVHAVGRHGRRAHAGDGEVGAHCLRISRRAIEAIAASAAFDPARGWFAFPTAERGTTITNCEDGYFCWLARQAGFHPIKVAPMGHVVQVVAFPGPGPGQTDLKFVSELMPTDQSPHLFNTNPLARPHCSTTLGEQPCPTRMK